MIAARVANGSVAVPRLTGIRTSHIGWLLREAAGCSGYGRSLAVYDDIDWTFVRDQVTRAAADVELNVREQVPSVKFTAAGAA